jgi:hypothetical protein
MVGMGPILEEVFFEHATFNFKITSDLQMWRKSPNILVG